MFIPTWLIVFVLIVIVSIFAPGFWRELRSLASCLLGLVVLLSIPASLYVYVYRKDTPAAFVVSVPWLALAVWWLWRASVEGITTSLWLHERRVRAAPSPEAVEKLRRGLADALGLDRKLWRLRDDVKYFPNWYAKTTIDGTPWSSNVIARDQIAEISTPDQARALGLDPAVLKNDVPYVVYSFSDGAKAYALCMGDNVETFGFDHDSDGEPLRACAVWVIEKPARIALAMRLTYYPGDADTFHSGELEAFKPGPWLRGLFSTADLVHQDEREKHERWRRKRERDNAESNFGK